MSMEEFVETDIFLTLDSGCCNHIVDMADAPGYASILMAMLRLALSEMEDCTRVL